MATTYKYRVGIACELIFDLPPVPSKLTPEQVRDNVLAALNPVLDQEDGLSLTQLPGGRVYPQWNPAKSVDSPDALPVEDVQVWAVIEEEA
jgi:hypothetical protein